LFSLNHRFNVRGDSEHCLQAALKFRLVNCRRELSQTPPTIGVIISKIALKQVCMVFGTA